EAILSRFPMRRRLITIAVLLAPLIGCGDGEPAGPDARTGAFEDGAPNIGPYDDPSDFDRQGCSDAVALDNVDLAGIWHLDLSFADFGSVAGTLRIDGTASSFSGLLLGEPADQVSVDRKNVLVRRAWFSEQSGYSRVQAM